MSIIIQNVLIYDSMNGEKRIQGTTLHLLLRLKNDLLITIFKNDIATHKNMFYKLSLLKQLDVIENVIDKDIKFRNSAKAI